MLSSGEIVVAFLCASSSEVLISLACVLMSVMKLTKVGVMCWVVCLGLCTVSGWCVGACLDVFPDDVKCLARLGEDCSALPLTLVLVGSLLMLTLLSWLRVSSSSHCSGV